MASSPLLSLPPPISGGGVGGGGGQDPVLTFWEQDKGAGAQRWVPRNDAFSPQLFTPLNFRPRVRLIEVKCDRFHQGGRHSTGAQCRSAAICLWLQLLLAALKSRQRQPARSGAPSRPLQPQGWSSALAACPCRCPQEGLFLCTRWPFS